MNNSAPKGSAIYALCNTNTEIGGSLFHPAMPLTGTRRGAQPLQSTFLETQELT
jgi:hypothetical protein